MIVTILTNPHQLFDNKDHEEAKYDENLSDRSCIARVHTIVKKYVAQLVFGVRNQLYETRAQEDPASKTVREAQDALILLAEVLRAASEYFLWQENAEEADNEYYAEEGNLDEE